MLHIPLDSIQTLRHIWVVSFCEMQVELENGSSVTQMMQTIFSASFGKQIKLFFSIYRTTIIKKIQGVH